MDLTKLVTASEEFVKQMLSVQLPGHMLFHNLDHTQRVVTAVTEIARHTGAGKKQTTILQIAAWFHDTGYCLAYDGHEDQSIIIATDFLKAHRCDEHIIAQVVACIAATRVPQLPQNLLQQIMRDADMYHLCIKEYMHLSVKLQKEWEIVLGKEYTAREWLQSSIGFLVAHHYFTAYGKTTLQQKKLLIIDELLKEL
ncbi:hypothetical protein A0256_09745 [Mucilaginibacter sp. PAMC 26640]|nr:hypothetical protein A0256_09745 [Mucilaginibacter sp. PAMC 26640]